MNKFYLLIILLIGCSETKVVTSIPLPDPPNLPSISSKELECLSNETYNKLYWKYELLKEYALTLEQLKK